MKPCDECDAPEICQGQTGNCTREITRDWFPDQKMSTPYPFKDAEEFAGFLIAHGLLEEDAWHDADGWDGSQTKEQIYRAWRAATGQ